MKITFTLMLALFFSITSFCQYDFTRNDNIDIIVDGAPLLSPWAGGINSAQVSRIDLNNDGMMDIFVFDRIGNRIMTYLSLDDTPGQSKYEHNYDYVSAFPELRSWALLRDFNCDGKQDIFTNSTSGIKIYENTSSGDELSFELRTSLLEASYNLSGSPFNAPVYCISVDLPSIVDYDGDGDMDIFTWTETASTIYYYKSLAQDVGNCDSLIYKTANRCYALVGEASESFNLFYGDDFECDFNVLDAEFHHENDVRDAMHTGGTVLNIDMDQNGIKDLILSDVTETFSAVAVLESDENGFDATVDVVEDFPQGYGTELGVDIRVFPGNYYEDVDNDGVRDYLCSPNGTVDTEDNNSLLLYKNNGLEDLPDFEFVQSDFLQEDMVDLGRGAYPATLDYNADGLMDLVVANKEYNINTNEQPSQLALFENTGTASQPEFTLIDLNWLDLPSFGLESVYPAFGDLDNDGDMDLVLGEETGVLHYFSNSAGSGNPVNLSLTIAQMTDVNNENIDVGQFSTPQLIDVNEDGDLDLIVGEKNGNINYIENTGDPDNYAFEHMIDTIGDVVATNFLGINGYSVPFMWRNGNDQLELLVGTEVGMINHYDNVDGNFDNAFNLVEESMDNIWEGTRSAACLYDFTDNDTLDLIYGQIGGGMAFYAGYEFIVSDEEFSTRQLSLYPNPAANQVTIDLRTIAEFRQLELFNELGQSISPVYRQQGQKVIIDTSALTEGLYLVCVQTTDERLISRMIVMRQ